MGEADQRIVFIINRKCNKNLIIGTFCIFGEGNYNGNVITGVKGVSVILVL